ncbi:hypothetical protein [Pseudobacter ginsenosidimutans]|uniref:Uncharacterized protein n=1 Tax=Pseudobacter ginsenosidimutans TaxID=661488 RepID=A0A4Q7MST3_9BACT|nr:hypothetical protein [Pseudobacter ginsenosidimutans]QEC41361.1 hypothetical protein FSB84_06500 [Pseudobacter ginsenosidimutans]RZS71865.1 hypothetical protein EV199_3778 [Pseudobacter ginsenosidimutans]
MNRRNFLFQSGMIAPAVLLMPDLVVGELQQDDTDLVIVQAGAGRVQTLVEQFRRSGKRLKEVSVVQLASIGWNGNRFRVSTKSGYSFTVKKLVINSSYMVDRERGLVLIPSAPKAMEISFEGRGESRTMPYFWAVKGKSLQDVQIESFLKQNVGGFMCVA